MGEPQDLVEGLSVTYETFYEEDPGQVGDIIEFDLLQKHGEQIVVNTYEIPNYRVRAMLAEPLFETDYMKVLRLLSPGDSVKIDIALNTIPQDQIPRELNSTNGNLTFIISVRNVWNEEKVIETMVSNLSDGNPEVWTKTSRGVRIFWDEEGKGPKAAFGDSLSIHVVGKFVSGYTFMSTFESEPVEFLLGEGIVEPKAWEDACSLVAEGDKITVLSPHEMAFGSLDRNPVLKYSTLVFEIDVLKVKKSQ